MLTRNELCRIRELSRSFDALKKKLRRLEFPPARRSTRQDRPRRLTAAKLIGEIAGVSRFASDAKLARAAADRRRSQPPPASTRRQRLDRGGNRQSTARCTGSPSAKPA